MKRTTLVVKDCVVCRTPVPVKELKELAEDFKDYPVHAECFDTYENADLFLLAGHNAKKRGSYYIEARDNTKAEKDYPLWLNLQKGV